MAFVEEVFGFCKHYFQSTSTVVIGVSGGIDSMVLLHVLANAVRADKTICESIQVVHVQHGLRDTAADDAAFVEMYCRRHQLSCHVIHVQVDVSSGTGVEAAARLARYKAFHEIADQFVNPVLVLAHHQMDQVETVLIRWLRGAGLNGLGAMRPVSDFEGFPVLRPFLNVPYEMISAYAEAEQLSHVVDATNEDSKFVRNDIRMHILPQLLRLQPELGRLTKRMTEQLQVDEDYLEEAARKLLRKIVLNWSGTEVILDRRLLLESHLSLQRRAIHIVLNCFASQGWSYRHIESVRAIASDGQSPSASLMLPHGLCARRRYDHLYIGCTLSSPDSAEPEKHIWDVENYARFSPDSVSMGWHFWALQRPRGKPKGNLWRLWIPRFLLLEIQFGVHLDKRVSPLGLGGSKKLQDLFVDMKIPRDFRLTWPVFSIDGEIVWIPGVTRTASHLMSNEDEACVITAHLPRLDRFKLGHRTDNANV